MQMVTGSQMLWICNVQPLYSITGQAITYITKFTSQTLPVKFSIYKEVYLYVVLTYGWYLNGSYTHVLGLAQSLG